MSEGGPTVEPRVARRSRTALDTSARDALSPPRAGALAGEPPEAGRLVCQRCGCDEVRRSHRRAWEHPLSWVGILPYRCLGCLRRFYH